LVLYYFVCLSVLLLGFYCKSLIQAKRANLVVEQIYFVDCLGLHYLEKKQFAQACKILNCELALFVREWKRLEQQASGPCDVRTESPYYRALVTRLESIETLYCNSLHQPRSSVVPSSIGEEASTTTTIAVNPDLNDCEAKEKEKDISDNDVSRLHVSYLDDCRHELSRARKECYALFDASMYMKAIRGNGGASDALPSSSATVDSQVPSNSNTPNMNFVSHYDAKYKNAAGMRFDGVIYVVDVLKKFVLYDVYCLLLLFLLLLLLLNRTDALAESHQGTSQDIREIQFLLTESYRKLLARLILDAQKLLGKPPTEW
jgi:hypothetical protein